MRLLWQRVARCTHSQLHPAPLKASLSFWKLLKWKAPAALPLLVALLRTCLLMRHCILHTSGRLKETLIRWRIRAKTWPSIRFVLLHETHDFFRQQVLRTSALVEKQLGTVAAVSDGKTLINTVRWMHIYLYEASLKSLCTFIYFFN